MSADVSAPRSHGAGATAAPAAAAAEPALPLVRIEARGLCHKYGRRVGLQPVEFEIEGPGVVAVTGTNGAGKSTLLRIVAGLLRPTEGELLVSVNRTDVPPAARRHVVGYAGPELAFYDEMSVAENLRFVAETRGLRDIGGRVAESLERVGLAVRADDRADALSSGMKARLRFAFALLHRPPVLLLDEPGSHMDEDGRRTLERIVSDEARHGLVVIATNEERERALAHRRIELRGRGLGPAA